MSEQTILLTALEKCDAAEQQAYLDRACAGDPALRERVEELLRGTEVTIRSGAGAAAGPGPADAERPDALAETRAELPAAGRARGGLRFLTPPAEPGHLGRLDRYEILEVIGRGGMGIVLRGFDEQLRRQVALKVLAPHLAGNATARKRFVREARAAAAVNHDHVVAVHGVHNTGAVPYLVMQYIAGASLQDRIDRAGPLEVPAILRTGWEVAAGLAAAHARGLVHRDVKPGNVLLEDGTGTARITDFGLARAADDASLTQSGAISGTPLYMSPEQARGEAVDARSDLFSLGTVLYVMCTGGPPFRAATAMAVVRRICNEAPRPIRAVNPAIPEALSALIARLHAPRAEDRVPSAAAVADLLGTYLTELRQHGRILSPPLAPPPREGPRSSAPAAAAPAPRTRTRHWVVLGLVGLLVALGVLAAGLTRRKANVRDGGAAPQPGRSDGTAGPATKPGPQGKAGGEGPGDRRGQGWVKLFDGKNHPALKAERSDGCWRVAKGLLIGSGRSGSLMMTRRTDYEDFHLRVEGKVSKGANSGVFFRGVPNRPGAYEVQIYGGDSGDNPTGTLSTIHTWPQHKILATPPTVLVPPDTWFGCEVIAEGKHLIVRINGRTVADVRDSTFSRGPICLECPEPPTTVQFRAIEIDEPPPTGQARGR